MSITTGGTFAGLGWWKSVPRLWQFVSFVTFCVTATHTFVNWQKSENDLSKLHERHSKISLRYKDLLMDMETMVAGVSLDKIKEEYKQIEKDEESIDTPAKFREYNYKLQLKCQNVVEIDIKSRSKKNG